jgi:type I restriction enzyme, S subunit
MTGLKAYEKYKKVKYDYVSQLPVGWQLWKIGHAFNLIGSGTTPQSGNIKFYENGSVNWINTGDLNDGVLDSCKNKITEEAFKKHSVLKIYPKGTLLVAMYGATIGKVAVMNIEGSTNQACCALAKSKILINKFALYWFLANRKNIVNLSYGGGQPNISQDVIKKLKIIAPPLEVQNNIVTYLDKKNNKIDKFIRNKERLIELLEDKRKEMIDNNLSSFKNLETNKKPLKYLVRLVSNLTTKLTKEVTYLALENIESWTGKIDLSIGQGQFESTVKKFKKTDVLFNKLRPYLAKVVIPDFNGVCVSEILVLRPSKKIDRKFLFYKLISRRFIDYVDTSTYGSKMPRASYDFIGKIEIEYPTQIDVQKNIVRKIEQKESKIENLKNKYKKEISSIKEYRESLITQVVTGQLKVPYLMKVK